MEEILNAQYTVVKVFKQSEDKSIVLLRHKVLQKELVCRKCRGNTAVYNILRATDFRNLPAVYAVFGEEPHITVLEEYIRGTTVSDL